MAKTNRLKDASMLPPPTRKNASFFNWDGDTLVLNVLGKPSARKNTIGPIHGAQLKVSVTASPTDGKATEYMVRFLAKAFGVSVSDIVVVFGQTSIHKQLRIHAPKQFPEHLEICMPS